MEEINYEQLNESLENGQISFYEFLDIIRNPSINVDEFYSNVYIHIVRNSGNRHFKICNSAYEFISRLNDAQIDELPFSTIGDHMFFRYLPSVRLISKYLSIHGINSNIFGGICYNTNISSDERKILLKSILQSASNQQFDKKE
jgi:hypothetical protein